MCAQAASLVFLSVSTRDAELMHALRDHYTGSAGAPPGKKRAWRILESGRHRGWIGLGEPPYKLAPLRRIGCADARPPEHTVCDWMFRLERPGATRASAILRAWHDVAGAEWATRYGWEPAHWLTMVDPEQVSSPVPGACYRRAGYRLLGPTTGRGARRPEGHGKGRKRLWGPSSVKLVFYRGPFPRVAESGRTPPPT